MAAIDARDRITAATGWMLTAHPWWATLLLHLKFVESTKVPTAATDGVNLLWNREFFDAITDTEILFVLAHEVAHCALRHVTRRGGRDSLVWNIACDAAANALLAADEFRIPATAIPPADLALTAEEIYALGRAASAKYYLSGDVLDGGGGGSETEIDQIDQHWREIVASARGLQPGMLGRSHVTSVPDTDPWSILSIWFSSHRRTADRTWSRLSRRHPMLPGRRSEPTGLVAVCIDTSGSISEMQLGLFLAHCRRLTNAENIDVALISCDAATHEIVHPGDPWPTVWTGGGGTDFRPAIEAAVALRPDCCVYLTDGIGELPKAPPIVPLLWALTQPRYMPWGRQIVLTRAAK